MVANPNPRPLRGLLQAAGARLGLDGALEIGLLWTRWSEIVGDTVAAHAEPTSLKAGVLRIRTDSPVWATEISYLTDEIKARSNRLAGRALVSEVRVWTSPDPIRRTHSTVVSRDAGMSEETSEGDPGGDPATAFARAQEAWRKRRSKGPSERPRKP